MNYYVGIDLGGTNIKGMIMNDQFQTVISRSSHTPYKQPPATTFSVIIDLIESMVISSTLNLLDVVGIGIGIPGLIDCRRNFVFNAANLGWIDVDAGSVIQEYFKKSVYTENDGNINVLGEMHFGAGIGAKNIILLTIGTGLGSGFILDGKLLHGASHVAAEAGHMVIESDGTQCSCGKFGCFESCCSGTALKRYARNFALENPGTLLLQYAGGDPKSITGEIIDKAFDAGDYAARQVIDVFTNKLSIGIVNLINLFNPEMIIISGGVSKSGDRILDPTRRLVESSLMHPIQHCNIVSGVLGTNAGVMGACMLVSENEQLVK